MTAIASLQETIKLLAGYVSLGLGCIAILVIVIGAAQAVTGIFNVSLARAFTHVQERAVWLKFARWLVAGLTFQLAADIVQTTVVPSWDEIGRVAAIAFIRTFLTYFLDRDMESMRDLQRTAGTGEKNVGPS